MLLDVAPVACSSLLSLFAAAALSRKLRSSCDASLSVRELRWRSAERTQKRARRSGKKQASGRKEKKAAVVKLTLFASSLCFPSRPSSTTFIHSKIIFLFPSPPPALWPCPEGGGRDLREKESSIRISPSLPLALSHFEKFLKKLKTSKKNSKNPENLFPAAAPSAPSLGPPSSPRPAPSSPRAPSSSTSSPRTRTSTAATGGTAPTSPRCCESSPTSRACAGSGCFIATLRTSPRS